MAGVSLPIAPRSVLDNSILGTLAACPRKTLYKYFLNIRAKEEDNTSVDFGSAYHRYREVLDKCAAQANEWKPEVFHQIALTMALQGFEDPPESHKKNYLDRTRLMKSCIAAFSKWKTEMENGSRKIVQLECSFQYPLPSGRLYGGRFDQIFEWNNRLWVKDYKTSSFAPTTKKDYYDLNHQMTGYVWAAQQLSGRQVDGVIVEICYNIKDKGPDIIPIMTTRTPNDVEAFLEWAEAGWDHVERAIETNRWPQYTISCNDFFRKCEFYGACENGSDWDAIEVWLNDNGTEFVWDFENPVDE